jgi:cell fate (sporulation/competence/biofilm development) regulator YmcA (YheA/YmcA/DUF963 family)
MTETLLVALKCSECKFTLESPVILPCGDSICQSHVKQETQEFHCLVCDLIHPIPNAGFPPNKNLAILINEKIDKLKFNPQYESAFDSFKCVEKLVDEMKLFQKDPYHIINKAIGELKNEVDIIKHEFNLAIENKASEIIGELEKYQQECRCNLDSVGVTNKLEKIDQNIDAIKEELGKWHQTLRCFESNETEWQVITEKSHEYNARFKFELDAYEDEFLLNKLDDYRRKIISFCTVELHSDRK